MTHWEYILLAANGLIGLATWRNVPLAVVRLVGALTKDTQRSRQCAEMVRLARKDAKDLPSYLVGSLRNDEPSVDEEPRTRKRSRLNGNRPQSNSRQGISSERRSAQGSRPTTHSPPAAPRSAAQHQPGERTRGGDAAISPGSGVLSAPAATRAERTRTAIDGIADTRA